MSERDFHNKPKKRSPNEAIVGTEHGMEKGVVPNQPAHRDCIWPFIRSSTDRIRREQGWSWKK